MSEPDDTYGHEGPRCPYCQHLHRADEPFFYDENNVEMDCDHCGKAFDMSVNHTVSWTCSPKDIAEIDPTPPDLMDGSPVL